MDVFKFDLSPQPIGDDMILPLWVRSRGGSQFDEDVFFEVEFTSVVLVFCALLLFPCLSGLEV